jgi:hypothetical protein
VFRESQFGKALFSKELPIPSPQMLTGIDHQLPFFLVADSAFRLSENIMRPYPGDTLSEKKKFRLSLARHTIENTFGILTQRWRILRKPIVANIDMCEVIEKATVALHNFLKTKHTDMPVHQIRYCRQGYVDYEDDNGELVLGQWRTGGTPLQSVNRLGSNNASRMIQSNRDALANYFLTPSGSVPWQLHQILIGSVPD